MDKTPNQILKEHPNTLEAMKVYAKQEALSFAGWLSNQVIHGRTITKLWADYEEELGLTVVEDDGIWEKLEHSGPIPTTEQIAYDQVNNKFSKP